MTAAPEHNGHEFQRALLKLGGTAEYGMILWVSNQPLHENLLSIRGLKAKLVHAVTHEVAVQQYRAQGQRAVMISPYAITRHERVRLALAACISEDIAPRGAHVIVLASAHPQADPDTAMRIVLGEDYDELRVLQAIGADEKLNPQVLETVLRLAVSIGIEGFEGDPVGTILVLGDSSRVMEKSEQIILNPFQGYSEREKNIFDPMVQDAVKNFAVLDGAFVLREDGVIVASGRYLRVGETQTRLGSGFGARHRAAAAISEETGAVSFVVSQTSGAVRMFRKGVTCIEIHPGVRRGN